MSWVSLSCMTKRTTAKPLGNTREVMNLARSRTGGGSDDVPYRIIYNDAAP